VSDRRHDFRALFGDPARSVCLVLVAVPGGLTYLAKHGQELTDHEARYGSVETEMATWHL